MPFGKDLKDLYPMQLEGWFNSSGAVHFATFLVANNQIQVTQEERLELLRSTVDVFAAESLLLLRAVAPSQEEDSSEEPFAV